MVKGIFSPEDQTAGSGGLPWIQCHSGSRSSVGSAVWQRLRSLWLSVAPLGREDAPFPSLKSTRASQDSAVSCLPRCQVATGGETSWPFPAQQSLQALSPGGAHTLPVSPLGLQASPHSVAWQSQGTHTGDCHAWGWGRGSALGWI